MKKPRKSVAPARAGRRSHNSYLNLFLPFKPNRRFRHVGL
jgi:hypothetical protein